MPQVPPEPEELPSAQGAAPIAGSPELQDLAAYRKGLLVGFYGLCAIYSAMWAFHARLGIASFLLSVVAARYAYKVSRGLGRSGFTCIGVVLAALVPLLNIVLLMRLAYESTLVLRASGYKVDFFVGAKPQ